MGETDALSLAELERSGRVWGSGRERRALCPFCGDEHARDRAHACLAVNADTGAWKCHRCHRSGLLEEHKTPREGRERYKDSAQKRRGRARAMHSLALAPPAASPPSPEEAAEAVRKREEARRLWTASLPIDAPEASPGAAYLAGRGIPLPVAVAAGVRYHPRYPDGVGDVTHYHAAVVFRVQGEDGAGVAIAARFLVKRPDSQKTKSRGTTGAGVFVALPGALEANGVTLCEGPVTALSMAACGFPAVALGGQNAPPWLARRLALREVFVALDEGEQATEAKAAALCNALARAGAKPYRLRFAPGVDVNDFLCAHGADTLREAVTAAVCRALGAA